MADNIRSGFASFSRFYVYGHDCSFVTEMSKGGNGLGWADQWDPHYDGDKANNVGGSKECNKNEKMDKAKAAASAGLRKTKAAATVRMVKTKVAATAGAKKLKAGTSASLKWIKGKVKK